MCHSVPPDALPLQVAEQRIKVLVARDDDIAAIGAIPAILLARLAQAERDMQVQRIVAVLRALDEAHLGAQGLPGLHAIHGEVLLMRTVQDAEAKVSAANQFELRSGRLHVLQI